MTLYGIDVSQHNGKIDWKQVKESGMVDFAIIRSSFGWTDGDPATRTDARFMENVKGCEENGIPYGFYHYSYCTNPENARKEARFFLNTIAGTRPTFPVALDMEDESQIAALNTEQRDRILSDFTDELLKAGYTVSVWSYLAFYEQYLTVSEIPDAVELWVSQYAKRNTFKHPHGLWQYSCTGKIPGIQGDVDLNVCYVDYPSRVRENGFNDPEKAKAYIDSNYGGAIIYTFDTSYRNAPTGHGQDVPAEAETEKADSPVSSAAASETDKRVKILELESEVAELRERLKRLEEKMQNS